MIEYSNNAISIYKRLYFATGETKPEDTHERVARFIANNDEEYDNFKIMLDTKIFRPNTPTLIAAGVDGNNSWDRNLSGCFVLGMDDSMESIIDVWSTCSKIYAGGAGSGIPITNLREEGSPIGGNKGKASGPLNYLHVIESVANTVKSGGRHRRASNLASARYNHPDILKIIDAKLDENNLNSFNISILVDDDFMNQVFKENDFEVALISPNKNQQVGTINGIEIWNKIVNNAWKTGDPGLLFYDTANAVHPYNEEIESSNPCGEVLLPPFSVCNLGSINLSKCIKNNEFSFQHFREYIKWSFRFLDNVIDKTDFVHEKFRERAMKERPVGLGIMSFSDTLFELNIPYNSSHAIALFKKICYTLNKTAIETSIELAKEKGSINISNSKLSDMIDYYTEENTSDKELLMDFAQHGIRNSTWTSIAPTGSISVSADCSYSFEPCFALVWTKELAETHELMFFVNPIFEKWLEINRPIEKESIIRMVADNHGSLKGLGFPKEVEDVFVTAHDISYFDKLKIQSAGQRYISLGISSTCNLPSSATVEDVSNAYINAWQMKLKGITVYRDGCKSWQPVNFGSKKECKEEVKIEEYNRPIRSHADHFEYPTSQGKMHLSICKDENNKIFQILIRLGKQGTLTNLLLDAMSRCISKALQYDVPLSVFAKTLRDNKDAPFWVKLNENDEKSTQVESVVDLIGIIFDMISQEDNELRNDVKIDYQKMERCPVCKEYTILRDSGCKSGRCTNEKCLYTSCG